MEIQTSQMMPLLNWLSLCQSIWKNFGEGHQKLTFRCVSLGFTFGLRCQTDTYFECALQTLHADSPVDASLFSLYVQQNYTQFCDDVDECFGLADALSEADGGMGILDDNVSVCSSVILITQTHHSLDLDDHIRCPVTAYIPTHRTKCPTFTSITRPTPIASNA